MRTKQQTAAIREQIVKLVLDGKTVKEIAGEVGITPEHTEAIVRRRLGFRRLLLTGEERDLINERRAKVGVALPDKWATA